MIVKETLRKKISRIKTPKGKSKLLSYIDEILEEEGKESHGEREGLFGYAKGKIKIKEGFDEPLIDFEEYM